MTKGHKREEENGHTKGIFPKTLQEIMSSSPELCKELTGKFVIAALGMDNEQRQPAIEWLAKNFFAYETRVTIGCAELGFGRRALVFTTHEMPYWQIATYVPVGARAIQTKSGIAYLSVN